MAARGAQGLIAVTALMGLAACGSVSAGSAARAGHPPSASVSASKTSAPANGGGRDALRGRPQRGPGRGQPDRLAAPGHAHRHDPGAGHGRRPVRAPAHAGRAACPAASAGSVRLVFAAGEQSFPPVSVQESGCRSVTGIGATRSWSRSRAFGVLLDEAVGGVGRLVPGTHPSSVPTGP